MISNFNLTLFYGLFIIFSASILVGIIAYFKAPIKKIKLLDDNDKIDDNAIMYLNIDLCNIYCKRINRLIKYYKRAYAISCFMLTASPLYLLFAMYLSRYLPKEVSVYRFIAISTFLISFTFIFGIKICKAINVGAGFARDSIDKLVYELSDIKYQYELSSEKINEYADKLKEEKDYLRYLIFNFSKIDAVVYAGFLVAAVFILLTICYSSSNSSVFYVGEDPYLF